MFDHFTKLSRVVYCTRLKIARKEKKEFFSHFMNFAKWAYGGTPMVGAMSLLQLTSGCSSVKLGSTVELPPRLCGSSPPEVPCLVAHVESTPWIGNTVLLLQ